MANGALSVFFNKVKALRPVLINIQIYVKVVPVQPTKEITMEKELAFAILLRKIFEIFGEFSEHSIQPFVEEEGRKVSLEEALMECIDALPLTKQRRDPEHPRPCMKLILLGHYGLEGPTKSLSELAGELGVSRSRVAQYKDKACLYLVGPKYGSSLLRRFFVPTLNKIADEEVFFQQGSGF